MQTKLTLRLDDRLIKKAKRVARERGKSLSGVVADYFSVLDAMRRPTPKPPRQDDTAGLTPNVRSLLGVLKGSKVTKEDYYRHLEEKYR